MRLPPVARECSAAAGSMILVALFAASAVLNYAFGVALAWLLVPSEFGIVSAVQNVLLLATGLLFAGLPWALARRLAETHGDPEAAKPEFRTALIANLGLGLLLSVAFVAAQLSGLQLVPTHSLLLDFTVAVEMPVQAVNGTLVGAASGSRRFFGVGAMQGGEILFKCIAAVFLVMVLHTGPVGIALSFVIGTLGSVLIGLRTVKGLLPSWGSLARLSFLAASGSFWFASASMAFLITADLLGFEVIGKAPGVTAAVLAGYQACGMLARASYYASAAFADAVFPFIAHGKTLREKHRWFMMAARWVPLLIIPIQVGLVLAPGPVLRLFLPDHYSGAHTLLRVLAAGTLGALMTNMLMVSLLAAGYGRQIARRMSISVIVEVTGLVTLVPGHGALGAAYSYLIASYVGAALLALLYLKALQVRMLGPRRLAAYAAGLAPTAVVFALAGLSSTPLAWALIVTGLCLFLLPARRMRLITDADLRVLQSLRSRLKARVAGVAVALSPAEDLGRATALAAFRADRAVGRVVAGHEERAPEPVMPAAGAHARIDTPARPIGDADAGR
jgi:O-antigen/teichoic acid export membrane protein